MASNNDTEWTYGGSKKTINATVEGLKFQDKFIPGVDYYIETDKNTDVGIHKCRPVVIGSEGTA